MSITETLNKIGDLYTKSLKDHGITAKGVGWTNEDRHQLRFDQLFYVCQNDKVPFSVNDLGCGYGALYNYLVDNKKELSHYYGYDISSEMLAQAKSIIPFKNAKFFQESILNTKADYTFSSGIFNVRFNETEEAWQEYVFKTIINMSEFSNKGFAFNLLSSYVDWKEDNLYYADPCMFFDFCKKHISRKVSLLHDTDLYEWTIIVRM